jgi:hypothetical protein
MNIEIKYRERPYLDEVANDLKVFNHKTFKCTVKVGNKKYKYKNGKLVKKESLKERIRNLRKEFEAMKMIIRNENI